MKLKNRIVLLLSGCLCWMGLQAQNTKTISVSQDASFTDHLSLNVDAKDMDMMVKFVFNEEANTLTVSLISYRTIFVFWDRVHLKPLVKGRTIRPDQLPYVATYEPTDRFKISKLFKSTVPRPRSTFYFQRWIDCDGLQPIPQEYAMVNDYISQSFDILNKRTQVTVRLHDVFFLEKQEKKKYNLYEIPFGRDLDMTYLVNIERNPCFGLDEEVASAKSALEGVKTSYESLKKKYGRGVVSSEESLNLFKELKTTLQNQFQKKEGQSNCQDLQVAWDDYNQYVDSIGVMKCKFQPESGEVAITLNSDGLTILTARARQIDKLVSRWLITNDPIERHDLEKQCEKLISDVNNLIKNNPGRTEQQKQVIAIFRAAEQYYYRTCKK